MLKGIGLLLVWLGCTGLGLHARYRLAQRVRTLDGLLFAFGVLQSEIGGRYTPLPALIGQLAKGYNHAIRPLFAALDTALHTQTDEDFAALWCACVEDKRSALALDGETCALLCEAAHYLGRFDATVQQAGLARDLARLKALRTHAYEALGQKGRLYTTSGAAIGLLAVLLLL